MEIQDQRDKIIEQLEALNEKMDRQNSVKRTFFMAILYGVGFFIGSAVIATIALGIFGPMVGKIGWVEENFQRGTEILHSN